MGIVVTRVIVQKVTVTVADNGNQTVVMAPAVNTSAAQQLAVTVAGTNQTVIMRPVE